MSGTVSPPDRTDEKIRTEDEERIRKEEEDEIREEEDARPHLKRDPNEVVNEASKLITPVRRAAKSDGKKDKEKIAKLEKEMKEKKNRNSCHEQDAKGSRRCKEAPQRT